MLLRRIVANLIDIIILIGATALGIYLIAPMGAMFDEPFFLLTVSQVCVIILIPIAVQSLFWLDSTTIGKMMMQTRVVNEKGEKLDYFQMLVRDYLSKVLSCYFVCIPVIFNRPGIHETITYSHVELSYQKKKK